ncbi:major facilitator superfamily domain-containing protein [Xylaria nigripes]|nr:major facilitator superfamily domain-containing protein [Xylaria nigripes]
MSGQPTASIPEEDRQSHDTIERAEAGIKDDVQDTATELPPAGQKNKYTIYTVVEKRLIVFAAAAGAFFSPLSAQIYFPALDALSRDLHVSVTQVNLTVTTYMILQATAPMFVGSFADSAGRRPAYILCFVIYIAACIGCALAPNYGALLALRALQSAGSSATVSLCQAVVADVITSAERGSYVGITSLPSVLAPSLGPVIGGVISQYLGWRWIFWFLAILAGTVGTLHLLFLPETCRQIVGDGSIRPHAFYRTFWQLLKDARRTKKRNADDRGDADGESSKKNLRIQRPKLTRTLFILFEKEMFLLLMYGSLIFAGFYAVSTAIPTQFSVIYGFDGVKIGLIYLPIGIGSIVSVFLVGKLANWNYRRHCKKLGIPYDRSRQNDMSEFPIEQARLQICIPFVGLFTVVIIGFGWAVQFQAHLAAQIVILFLFGGCIVALSNILSTLIVDINPGVAGAATAANNLTRCLVGAGASAFINPLMTAIGPGWAFTIIGLACVVSAPAPYMVMRHGIKWRKEKAHKAELKKQQKKRGENAEPSDDDVEKAQTPTPKRGSEE